MNNGIFNIKEGSNASINGGLVSMPYGMGGGLNSFATPYNMSEGNPDEDFVVMIDTNINPISTAPLSLIIPFTTGATVDCRILWGDGTSDYYNTAGDKTHTYPSHGTYIVRIRGRVSAIGLSGSVSNYLGSKVIKIISFGSNVDSIAEAFGASTTKAQFIGLIDVPLYLPPNLTNLNGLFGVIGSTTATVSATLPAVFYPSTVSRLSSIIKDWNISKVTSIAGLFINYPQLVNLLSLKYWDTSNVTNMSNLFLNNFGVYGNGTTMNVPDVTSWSVSKVTNFSQTFSFATFATNAQDFSNWDTSSATNMLGMFGPTNFNNAGSITSGVALWDVSNVTNMSTMFRNNTHNANLSNWNVGNVTTFDNMFLGCGSWNNGGSPGISGWDTGSSINMSNMFNSATSFNQPIGTWNVTGVTLMNNMFNSATSFNQPLNEWNTSNVTNMASMFNSSTQFGSFNQNIGTWNVGKVTDMNNMFFGLFGTSSRNPFNNGGSPSISGWNTSNVVSMAQMFTGCSGFNQPIGSWNTGKVTAMNSLFNGCFAFNQNIGSWNVSGVTTFLSMFNNATGFNNGGSSSISGWDTRRATNMSSMFSSANSFNQPVNYWNMTGVTTIASMFAGANSFNQTLSGWNLCSIIVGGGITLSSTAFSTENYDNTLIDWNNRKSVGVNGVRNWTVGVTHNFGTTRCSFAGGGAAARSGLTAYGITITDGGAPL